MHYRLLKKMFLLMLVVTMALTTMPDLYGQSTKKREQELQRRSDKNLPDLPEWVLRDERPPDYLVRAEQKRQQELQRMSDKNLSDLPEWELLDEPPPDHHLRALRKGSGPGLIPAGQGSEVRVTHNNGDTDYPDVAVDSQGNVHIVFTTDSYQSDDAAIVYTMLDNDGNTLIDDTRLTPDDGYASKRPAIVVDSNDKVHITFKDYRPNGIGAWEQEIYYTKLDPYLDDRNGDAANEAAITLVQDKMISDLRADYIGYCRMGVDSDDNIHVVWEGVDDFQFLYAKLDNDGNKLVGDLVFDLGLSWRNFINLAFDSNNDVHLAWNDVGNTSDFETYYMMLDGSNGNTLIDRTLISPNDSESSKGQSILVDHQDKVHIFWKDQRTGDQEVWYTKLDPGLDDQNGNAADEGVITVIDDRPIGGGGHWVKNIGSAFSSDHKIYLSWWDDDTDNLYYQVRDTDGNYVVSRRLTSTNSVTSSASWTVPFLDVDSNGKAHIVWCDDRDGAYEVYYTGVTPDPPGPEKEVTHYINKTDAPDIATDSNGNVHIVFVGTHTPGDTDSGSDIIYTMLDNNGNTLIDETRITPDDAYAKKRPAIVVDSNDKVHITYKDRKYWRELSGGDEQEIYYTKLDPYLDDRNGDAANEAAITLVQDRMISDPYLDYLGACRMAVDHDDNIHVVWETDGGVPDDDLFYAKLDNNGTKLIGDIVIHVGIYWRASVDLAIDSNNDVHLAWNDIGDTDEFETYYMMLNGSNGSILIDRTLITPDDDEHSKGQSILVDHQDKVHILWKDQRTGDQEVWYTKLDPGLDDRDGDAADEGVISVIDDKIVGGGGQWVKRIGSAIHCGHFIHIIWWDWYTEDLFTTILDTDGNTVVAQAALTTTGSVTAVKGGTGGWMVPYVDVDDDGKAHITWLDGRQGGIEVYYINNQGPTIIPGKDFGDAPDPLVAMPPGRYPTLLANNGPRHNLSCELSLGLLFDSEPDGQQNLTATGDDTDGTDDDDGVNPVQLVLFKGVAPNINVNLKNTTGNPATLSGWIDYDLDGIFEVTERAQAVVPDGATQAILVFPVVPMNAPIATYARFRISTNGAAVANPTGEAPDGEVEDYPVVIGGVQVVLTSPNAGEWIRGGSAYEVTWYTVPPNVGRIALYISTDGGYSYPEIIADGLPNNGKYVWTTPRINSRNCRIKIELHGSLLAQDVSDANHTIDSTPPHVVLTYPVGGVTWIAGGTYTITWNPATDNYRLADKPISLHYTTDNWQTYTVFATDLDNTGRYDWTVPAGLAGTTTLQIKARAVDYVGNVYCGHHGGTITVQAAPSPMMVTYPNGGETLAGGSVQTITWTSNIPSPKVNISYSLDGGETYPHEIAINEVNDGAFDWTVPMMNTRKLRLKIKAHGGAIDEEDASDGDVTIDDTPPVVTLISPNGGEVIEAGGAFDIGWTAEDNYGLTENPILLMYSEDCGISFSDTIAAGEVNDGTFGWLVPSKLNTGKLRILIEATDRAGHRKSDTSDEDLSASPAMLTLTSPLGGDKWQGGTTHEITWNSALPEGTVTLKYSTDGGTTYPNLIAEDQANDGTFGWTLPSLNSQSMRLKVEVNSARTAEAVNHADFTIDSSPPNLTLQSLNGGDSLEAGGSCEIRWTASDNFGLEDNPITITCSTDGGFTYPDTIAEDEANDSSHIWITPTDLKSDRVRLKIEAIDETGLKRSACSAGTFTIMPLEITIVSPDGGEVWRGMTFQRISWTSNFTTGTVSLSYSTDGGSTYPHIIATGLTNGIGSYDWEVPQINEESVRVRADLGLQNHTHDMSNGNFEIRHHAPEVTLIYPSGGEIWEANSVNKIIWTARDDYFGLITDPITIHYSTDGGRTFPHTIAKKEVNDSTYVWTTPGDLNSPNVRIRVEALNVRDVSGYDTIDEDMGILNPPPVVSSLPDSSFEVNNALYFFLNPYVTDNNDRLLTLMWSAWSSEPAVEVFVNNDNKWCTILARNWTGEADVVLTVTDPFGDSDSDTMHVVVNGQTAVEEITVASLPEDFVLYQNYPNPFNPETTISFGLPEGSEVIVTIFDMNGKHVTDLFEGRKEAGVHFLRWNAVDCPSGVYFISMRTGKFIQMRKCILMK